MPPHPIHASYTHIIRAGLENITRLAAESNSHELLRNETEHLIALNKILTNYLLYSHRGGEEGHWIDSEHLRYWDELRPAYMAKATGDCIWNHMTGWSFLAFATSGHELMYQIEDECEPYRPREK